MNQDEIRSIIRTFLIENIFQGKDEGELKDDTALISSRVMDSIVALKMVSFLEDKFKIEFEAHEVDQENLETVNTIVNFVQNKMK